MKTFLHAGLSLSALISPSLSLAQDSRPEAYPQAADMRPLGVALGYATAAPPLVSRTPLKQLCGIRVGCIFIVNHTKNWDIIGFYLDVSDPKRGEASRWYNQFDGKLRPMQATGFPRMGDSRMTAVPLKVVWRDRKSGEKIEAFTTLNLFDDPQHGSYIIHAVVQKARVIVEPDVVGTTEPNVKSISS